MISRGHRYDITCNTTWTQAWIIYIHGLKRGAHTQRGGDGSWLPRVPECLGIHPLVKHCYVKERWVIGL